MREERVGLEHHVDRPLVRRHAGERLAVEPDRALGRLLEAGEHAQQRGLAAAGGAEQRVELALVDVERLVVDGDESAEPLGDGAELDEGLCRRVVPRLEFAAHRAEHVLRHAPPMLGASPLGVRSPRWSEAAMPGRHRRRDPGFARFARIPGYGAATLTGPSSLPSRCA